jgi:hypothetical protein
MSSPQTLGVGLTLTGFVAGLVGLAGFYPELSDRTPRLAKTSLAAAVGACVGLATLLVWALAMVLLSAPEPSLVIALPTLLLMLSTYCLFGVAILRTTAYSRSIGLMLLALVGELDHAHLGVRSLLVAYRKFRSRAGSSEVPQARDTPAAARSAAARASCVFARASSSNARSSSGNCVHAVAVPISKATPATAGNLVKLVRMTVLPTHGVSRNLAPLR